MFRQGRLRTAEEAAGRPPGAETQCKLQCKIRYSLQYKWQYKMQYNLQYRVQYNIPYEFRAPLVSLVPSLWVSLVSLASCLHLHGSQRSTAEVSSRAATHPIRIKKFICVWNRRFVHTFSPRQVLLDRVRGAKWGGRHRDVLPYRFNKKRIDNFPRLSCVLWRKDWFRTRIQLDHFLSNWKGAGSAVSRPWKIKENQ